MSSFLGVLIPYCLLGLLLQTSAHAESPYSHRKVPTIYVNSEVLSPQQVGLAIGKESKRLFPNIEQLYDKHLSKVLHQAQFKQILKHKLPRLLSQVNDKYLDEMKGVAGAWSVIYKNKLGDGLLSMDEFLVLNLLADIGYAPDGTGFGVYGKTAANGSTIVGRNTDWQSTPELRSLQTITVYQNNSDSSVVNIGFAGLASLLTGFNKQGLFLSLLNAEPYSPYMRHGPHKANRLSRSNATVFSLRETLANSKNISHASKYLSKKTFATGENLLIADKSKVLVLEFAAQKNYKKRNWKSQTHPNKPWGKKLQIAAVDCHVLKSLVDNCTESKDNYRWFRLRKLATFSGESPATEQDMSSILFDENNNKNEIFNDKTISSLYFTPKNNELYLYTTPSENVIPQTTAHTPYLDLLPSSNAPLSTKKKTTSINIVELIWASLLLMILIMAWSYKLHTKAIEKCKEMLN